jgi:hypothetical protein
VANVVRRTKVEDDLARIVSGERVVVEREGFSEVPRQRRRERADVDPLRGRPQALGRIDRAMIRREHDDVRNVEPIEVLEKRAERLVQRGELSAALGAAVTVTVPDVVRRREADGQEVRRLAAAEMVGSN